MRSTVIEKVLRNKIITIIRGLEGEKILKLVEALYAGGIELVEVTFDQSRPENFRETAEAIRTINRRFGGKVLAGAGTVTTPELVRLAAEAGARYIISPNTDANVIRTTLEMGLVSMPGAFTPTEVLAAHNAGADFVKVFPVSSLGSEYIKALRAPVSHVKLLAVGGVNEENVREYLDAGCAGVGVGGNLVNKKWIEAGEFAKITALAETFLQKMNER